MSYIEGFSDPTMSTIFDTMLTISLQKQTQSRADSSKESGKRSGSSVSSCPPKSVAPGQPLLTATDLDAREDQPTSFLKTVIEQQKQSVDSLMTTAKRVNPIAKKTSQMEAAYDAAFENSAPAAQPMLGSTVQGFILLFFAVSYVALTIVTCMTVNMLTDSGTKTAGTFVAFLVLGIILLSLLIQLG